MHIYMHTFVVDINIHLLLIEIFFINCVRIGYFIQILLYSPTDASNIVKVMN